MWKERSRSGEQEEGDLIRKQTEVSPFSGVAYHILSIFFNADEIQWNPPRPEINKDDVQHKQVCFSRTSSGGSFVASDVPNAPIPDLFPPGQITDLKAEIHGGSLINLTWTAPGDDYDRGTGELNLVWTL